MARVKNTADPGTRAILPECNSAIIAESGVCWAMTWSRTAVAPRCQIHITP